MSPATASVERPSLPLSDAKEVEVKPSLPLSDAKEAEVKPKKPRSPWDTRHEFAHVDRMFILVFPIAFVSFNILYWLLCVYFQDYLRGGD